MKRMKLIFFLALSVVLFAATTFLTLAAEHNSGSGTVTVSDYQLTYTWITTYEKANASQSGDNNGGSGSVSLSGTTFTIAAKSSYFKKQSLVNWKQDIVYNYTTVLTIKNEGSSGCKITYDVQGSCVRGEAQGESSVELAKGETKTFTVGTTTAATSTSAQNLSGLVTITKIEVINSAKTTLQSSGKGAYSYTIGDTTSPVAAGSADVVLTEAVDTPVILTAGQANSDYAFYGWMSDGKLLSTDSSYTHTVSVDSTIYPAFLPAKVVAAGAPFKVGSNFYMFWHLACEDALTTGNMIILTKDYVLPTTLEENGLKNINQFVLDDGDDLVYIVPQNVNFLIPFSSSHTASFSSEPTNHFLTEAEACTLFDAGERNSVYCELTIPVGAVMECYGNINVNGQRQNTGQPYTGVSVGGYGKIVLGAEPDLANYSLPSLVDLKPQLIIYDGGNLFCYGYITGTGMVELKSGASSYELMQICDWPGGSNGYDWQKDHSSGGFMLTQYYVQNIEAPLKVTYGAFCHAEAIVYVSDNNFTSSATMIGTKESGEGFLLMNAGASGIRVYDVINDRMHYHLLDGTVDFGSLKVEFTYAYVFNVLLDSQNYILPLASNMSLHIENGATVNMGNAFSILPGAEIVVETGGVLNVTNALYIWDAKDWSGSYFFNRADMLLNSGEQRKYSTKSSINCAPLPYVATLHSVSPQSTSYGIVRGYTVDPDDGSIAQRYYVDPEKQTSSGQLVVNGTLNVSGILAISAKSTSPSADKIVTGTGIININSTPSAGALNAGYSSSVTTIATTVSIGNLSGIGTNQPFSAGTYYGLGSDYSNYWYQRQITPIFQNCAGGTVSGGKLTVTNGITGYIVSGGAFTITLPSGYSLDDVSADNGWTVSGEYTITGGEADRTTPVTVTVSLTHVPGTTATCTADQLCTVCNTVLKEALGHEYGWAPVETNGTNGTKYVNHLCCGRCEDLLATVDLQYRLDDYIWMNAIVDLVKAGSITVSDGVSLVEVSDTQYYLVRKVVAKELTTVFTAELAINGITEPFTIQLGFSAFDATLPDGHVHKSLVAAMLNYGKAADDYFEDGTNFSSSENVFTGDDAPVNFRKKQHEALNNYNGVQLKTANASVSFANCLGLGIYFHTTGEFALSEGDQIVQVGLLVGMGETYLSDADLGMLKVDDHAYDRAYILYDLDETFEFSNKPNYGSDKVTLVNGVLKECPDINISTPICIDLTHDMYTQRMALRPYVVIKHADGTYTNLYGEQYLYGLEAYCASVNANGKTVQSRNLVYYAWNYAKLAATTNFN